MTWLTDTSETWLDMPRDESHVMVEGIPADIYFARLERSQRDKQRRQLKKLCLRAVGFVLFIGGLSGWLAK